MTSDLIEDTAQRLFSRLSLPATAQDTASAGPVWQAAEEAGFPLALLSEAEGGFGLEPVDAMTPLLIAARHAAALPLAETMLANWLLARAGLPPVEGPAAVSFAPDTPVAWGRLAQSLIVLDQTAGLRVVLPTRDFWTPGRSIAGEPLDSISAPLPETKSHDLSLHPLAPQAMAALLRAQQMAGAMHSVLALSLRYANERVQFGRTLAKFQAIQHYLSVMAAETAAAGAAAQMAAAATPLADSKPETFIALAGAAKIRTGEAASKVAELAHQVNGAIGFSHEYALHPLTRRLWSWRDLDGRECDWARRLGATLRSGSPGEIWPRITALQSEAL